MAHVICDCGFQKTGVVDDHIGRAARCPKCGEDLVVSADTDGPGVIMDVDAMIAETLSERMEELGESVERESAVVVRNYDTSVDLYATPTIEDPEMSIEETLPVIVATANVGMGLITDVGVAMADTFGGTSKALDGKMDHLIETVKNRLRGKVPQQATAVVGFTLNISWVTTGTTVVLHATAYGSPVVLRRTVADSI